MPGITKLLQRINEAEAQMLVAEFFAPRVRGGRVRTKVAGLIYAFATRPSDFEGWGIFKPLSASEAVLMGEADEIAVAQYLQLFPSLRLRLVDGLRDGTWLAYPANESDMQQRFGAAKPVMVHLVRQAARFEPIIARWDGASFWFDEVDRRADPTHAEQLRDEIKRLALPSALRIKDLTPEMRSTYALAIAPMIEAQATAQQHDDETRLQAALSLGGGSLHGFHNRGEFWLVEWTTVQGERHTSAIQKNDLTVMSSGICLSGCDRDFDLQSLVGVAENR